MKRRAAAPSTGLEDLPAELRVCFVEDWTIEHDPVLAWVAFHRARDQWCRSSGVRPLDLSRAHPQRRPRFRDLERTSS